ncbi:MAG: porin family protein [Rhizobium sp.]|nr:porin family protein [Rhizobium sp.]
MKKALLLSAVIASASSAAYAADAIDSIPAAPEAVEETVVPAGWDGPYLGVMGGAEWLKSRYDFGATSASRTQGGGLIGKFAGYNMQFDNNFVLGIEGDVSYNWNKKTVQGYEAGTDWSGSVRARAGYAFDNALIYGAAGWTVTRGYIDPPTGGKSTKALNGYTLGAGVDYKFNDNMFVRAEYRFNDYTSKSIKGVEFDPQQHSVILGVGYKF